MMDAIRTAMGEYESPTTTALSSSTYQYDALCPGQMRLLHIHPGQHDTIIHTTLQVVAVEELQDNPYSALSYVWGNDSQPRHMIALNDKPFEVRENLFTALKRFRSCNTPQVFWIDAICIDQKNQEEKLVQIPLMTQIYSKARTVEIWLGPSLRREDKALEAITSGTLRKLATVDMMTDIITLLQKEWFERLWIIQEVALAGIDAAYVNCGTAKCAWESLCKAVETGADDAFEPFFSKLVGCMDPILEATNDAKRLYVQLINERLHRGFIILRIGSIRQLLKDSVTGLLPSSLVSDLCVSMRQAKATQAIDKIIGLCGMLPEPISASLLSDPSISEQELFHAVTCHILQHGDASNIFLHLPTIRTTALIKRVPTWTLDFSYTNRVYVEEAFEIRSHYKQLPQEYTSQLCNAKQDLIIDGCIIDGCIIDVVKIVQAQEEKFTGPQNTVERQRFWIEMLKVASDQVLDVFYGANANEAEKLELPFMSGNLAVCHTEQTKTEKESEPENTEAHFTGTEREFWIHLLQNDPEHILKTFTDDFERELIRDFIYAVNCSTYLEKIDAMLAIAIRTSHESSQSCHFWSRMITDRQGLREYDIERQLDILLGNADDQLSEHAYPGYAFWEAATQVLGIPESKALSYVRFQTATDLLSDIESVLGKWSGLNEDLRVTVFMTDNGLPGIALASIMSSDQVATLFRGSACEISFILRTEASGKYPMVCPAKLPSNWMGIVGAETRKITIV